MMLYRDISLVSIFGLRGTLDVQSVEDAEGVTVQADGPYEAKVVDSAWLMIYPEGREPHFPRWVQSNSEMDAVIGGTYVGSVIVSARARYLTDSLPTTEVSPPVVTRSAVQITAPTGTKFELVGCYGMREGPRGARLMRGKDRFETR